MHIISTCHQEGVLFFCHAQGPKRAFVLLNCSRCGKQVFESPVALEPVSRAPIPSTVQAWLRGSVLEIWTEQDGTYFFEILTEAAPSEPPSMMQHLALYKAQPLTPDRQIPSVTIALKESWPEDPPRQGPVPADWLAQHQAKHRHQAEQLVDALMASLPQGTMHEALAYLLVRYGSAYRGPTHDAGPLVRSQQPYSPLMNKGPSNVLRQRD